MEQTASSTTFAGSQNYGLQQGPFSGQQTNHFYTSTAAVVSPTPAPAPSIFVPFRRDRDFVERPILNEVWRRTLQPAARVGLFGLGGVGKTQLAVEYAYRRHAADDQLWVFWVHASSAARFEQSYRQNAQDVGIGGWDDPQVDVLSLVRSWFSNEHNGRWTMVVDNADSQEVVFGSQQRDDSSPSTSTSLLAHNRTIHDCLPSAAHGSLVITSRSRQVVDGLIEYAEDVLEVAPMQEEESVALLRQKLQHSIHDLDSAVLVRLAHALDYMPLAITQGAAYIQQAGPAMTVSRYLQVLEQSDTGRDQLLEQNLRDPRRDGEAANSILTTWHTSFEHVRQTRSSAARLLALMSQFNREGISKNLLSGQYYSLSMTKHNSGATHIGKKSLSHRITAALSRTGEDRPRATGQASSTHDRDNYEEDLRLLRAYSLVGVNTTGELYEMHRLVQCSTRKWLELHNELVGWQARYTSVLNTAFPTGEYKNWPTCQALFPHVETLLQCSTVEEDRDCRRAAILSLGLWYARLSGQYAIGIQMGRASLAEREEKLGANHSDTLSSVRKLASVLQAQGQYGEAEALNRRALAGKEKELGASHPSTLVSVGDLALLLYDQGKFEESQTLQRKALLGREKELGSVVRAQGRYSDAEVLACRALEGNKKTLGPDHPDTLTSANILVEVWTDQGKYSEAGELIRHTLAERQARLGPVHPDTLKSIETLATILHAQGEYSQAETHVRYALSGREEQLGASHPDTLTSVSNLAHLYHMQGRHQEALELYSRAVRGRSRVLGASHPLTLASQHDQQMLLREIQSR